MGGARARTTSFSSLYVDVPDNEQVGGVGKRVAELETKSSVLRTPVFVPIQDLVPFIVLYCGSVSAACTESAVEHSVTIRKLSMPAFLFFFPSTKGALRFCRVTEGKKEMRRRRGPSDPWTPRPQTFHF